MVNLAAPGEDDVITFGGLDLASPANTDADSGRLNVYLIASIDL